MISHRKHKKVLIMVYIDSSAVQQFKRYEYYDMDTSSWQDLGYIVFSKERKKPYNLHSIEQVHRMGSPAVYYNGKFQKEKMKESRDSLLRGGSSFSHLENAMRWI